MSDAGPMNNASQFSGGSFIKFLALCGILVFVIVHPASAAESSSLTKAAAWDLGNNLSIAAILYEQDKEPDADQVFTKAKQLADALGVEIRPFPVKSSIRSLDVIHYLSQGDGARIGEALGMKYNYEYRILYEISAKSNLLLILYDPDDPKVYSLGKSISDVVKSRCEQIDLPSKLWMGLVTAVTNKSSPDNVGNAVMKMHEDVKTYLSTDR